MPDRSPLSDTVQALRRELREKQEEIRALHDRGLDGLRVSAKLATLVDSVVTLFAVGFLLWTSRLSQFVKGAFFSLVALTTGYAVINNFRAIDALGLSPLGLG